MLLKIISIILCCLIIILCYLTRRKSESPKNKLYIIISIGVVLLFLINIPGFMKAYFVGFDSPEDAYKYETGGKASLVLEGTITDYVFGNKDSVILEKDENGWRIPKSSTMTAKAMKSKGKITVSVRQYNKMDEDASYYGAYVNVMDDEYKLYINGEEISIF